MMGNWLQDNGLRYDPATRDDYPAFSAASSIRTLCAFCGTPWLGRWQPWCCDRRRDHVGSVEDRQAIERLESRGYEVRKAGEGG
jgi:hypothetical protein